MADIKVQVTSNKDEVLKAAEAAISRAMERIGLRAERMAKTYCPVDTGRLRSSISHTSTEKSAIIGTNVEYAPFVELGTSRRSPTPYLAPAIENHLDEYRQIVESELKD